MEKGLKLLTTKQMLQRLLIALAQVKTGNTSKNLKWNSSNHMSFLLGKRNINL